MNYAPPERNPECFCLRSGALPIFCMSGHMLECHYPLDCRTAACSHLPRYYEDLIDPELFGRVEERARSFMALAADKDCSDCGGRGQVEVQWEEKLERQAAEFFRQAQVDVDPDHFPRSALRVCPCVVREVTREETA